MSDDIDMQEMIEIKCMVCAVDTNGESYVHPVIVTGTREEILNGWHFYAVEESMKKLNPEDSEFVTFTEQDPEGRALMPLYDWDHVARETLDLTDGPEDAEK